jgi:glycosyltransferase involved in cell wall biosynthesis
MARKVLMGWQASSFFGWGILGLNLFELWLADPDIQPLMGSPISPRDIAGIDPLRYSMMQPAIAASNQFLADLAAGKAGLKEQGVVLIEAFGNALAPAAVFFGAIGGCSVARCIFENTRIESTQSIEKYDNLLCASEWNASLLRGATNRSVTMIHEGIDQSLFFPGPRSGVLDTECFYVFTGGKVEFRKAQDLVILAFREFAARHDDAVLVAAWNSPWPEFSAGFQAKLTAPLRRGSNGALDLRRWVTENGIQPHQFIDLSMTPNFSMPTVLREMDCALQVSRCEACTNLPAKEAMACGVPVILANNTGTRDLIDADNCVALTSQGPVTGPPGVGTDGWGESSVAEIVEALEKLYTDTQVRKRIGARGAQWILEHRRTWRDHASDLKAHLLSLL